MHFFLSYKNCGFKCIGEESWLLRLSNALIPRFALDHCRQTHYIFKNPEISYVNVYIQVLWDIAWGDQLSLLK